MASSLLLRGARVVCSRGSGGKLLIGADASVPFSITRIASTSLTRSGVNSRLSARAYYLSPCKTLRPVGVLSDCNQSRAQLVAWYSNGAQRGVQGQGGATGEGSEVKKELLRKGNIEKVKTVLKEYGTVGVVFHMTISLFSVGTCYLLVSK